MVFLGVGREGEGAFIGIGGLTPFVASSLSRERSVSSSFKVACYRDLLRNNLYKEQSEICILEMLRKNVQGCTLTVAYGFSQQETKCY